MRSRPVSRSLSLLCLAAAGLILTGCAAPGGQSVAEACAILREPISGAQERMQEALLGGDARPDSPRALFDGIDADIETALNNVSNPEVAAVAGAARTSIQDVGDALEGLGGNPGNADPGAVMAVISVSERAVGEYTRLCR